MAEIIELDVVSRFDHVPNELGWEVNVPEFGNRSKSTEFVRLTLRFAGVSLIFAEQNMPTVVDYTVKGYDDEWLGTVLKRGSRHFTEPKLATGYLCGFPILADTSNRTTLGVEICGDPNDIHSTNEVYRLTDVTEFGVADKQQVKLMQALENELVNRVTVDSTKFIHPEPVALYGENRTPLYRPMTDDEREKLRMSLPFTYRSVKHHVAAQESEFADDIR